MTSKSSPQEKGATRYQLTLYARPTPLPSAALYDQGCFEEMVNRYSRDEDHALFFGYFLPPVQPLVGSLSSPFNRPAIRVPT